MPSAGAERHPNHDVPHADPAPRPPRVDGDERMIDHARALEPGGRRPRFRSVGRGSRRAARSPRRLRRMSRFNDGLDGTHGPVRPARHGRAGRPPVADRGRRARPWPTRRRPKPGRRHRSARRDPAEALPWAARARRERGGRGRPHRRRARLGAAAKRRRCGGRQPVAASPTASGWRSLGPDGSPGASGVPALAARPAKATGRGRRARPGQRRAAAVGLDSGFRLTMLDGTSPIERRPASEVDPPVAFTVTPEPDGTASG